MRESQVLGCVRPTRGLFALYLVLVVESVLLGRGVATTTAGVLRVHPDNPRWFADGSGRAIFLGGHQIFVDLQDNSFNKPYTRNKEQTLAWDRYVEFLKAHHFNYLRNWVIWSTGSGAMAPANDAVAVPMPYQRVDGHGQAKDGGDKFDVTRFDEVFFHRMRHRCEDLQDAGIRVSIMLFEVYGFLRGETVGSPPQSLWDGNVFNGANNVNGIDVDYDGNGNGIEFFYTDDPQVRRLQKAYVRKVLDTLNDLDNVFFEIANELEAPSWQYDMIEYIRHYESSKRKQHLVLMSAGGRTRTGGGRQMAGDRVINSPADCFAVAGSWQSNRFRKKDPPANNYAKPGIVDMDHVSPGSTDVGYVWSAFTRGYHFSLYDRPFERPDAEGLPWKRVRQSVGQAVKYAGRLDLAKAAPRPDLASTRYCLANPGCQYVVYQPEDGPIKVSGLKPGRFYDYEVFHAVQGKVVLQGRIQASGSSESFRAAGQESVLFLHASSDDAPAKN